MTTKQRQKAFVTASHVGDVPTQVRFAREMARALITYRGGIQSDPQDPIDELVGHPFDKARTDGDVDTWTDYCDHVNAALALGIAIGQLVHPDVFKTGGAK